MKPYQSECHQALGDMYDVALQHADYLFRTSIGLMRTIVWGVYIDGEGKLYEKSEYGYYRSDLMAVKERDRLTSKKKKEPLTQMEQKALDFLNKFVSLKRAGSTKKL